MPPKEDPTTSTSSQNNNKIFSFRTFKTLFWGASAQVNSELTSGKIHPGNPTTAPSTTPSSPSTSREGSIVPDPKDPAAQQSQKKPIKTLKVKTLDDLYKDSTDRIKAFDLFDDLSSAIEDDEDDEDHKSYKHIMAISKEIHGILGEMTETKKPRNCIKYLNKDQTTVSLNNHDEYQRILLSDYPKYVKGIAKKYNEIRQAIQKFNPAAEKEGHCNFPVIKGPKSLIAAILHEKLLWDLANVHFYDREGNDIEIITEKNSLRNLYLNMADKRYGALVMLNYLNKKIISRFKDPRISKDTANQCINEVLDVAKRINDLKQPLKPEALEAIHEDAVKKLKNDYKNIFYTEVAVPEYDDEESDSESVKELIDEACYARNNSSTMFSSDRSTSGTPFKDNNESHELEDKANFVETSFYRQ